MGGRHLLHVYNSSHAYRMKRLTAYIPMSVKRYSEGKKVHEDHEQQQHVHEERAPSTAEEFRRVAEEKSHRDAAASDHHTSEEEEHGSEETTTSDSDVESVEEKTLNHPSSVEPTS